MKRRRGVPSKSRKPPRRNPSSPAPPGEPILLRVEGSVAWITLNRPEQHNALSGTMREDLLARIESAGADPEIRALVITGAGDAFCTGGDVHAMSEMKRRRESFEALDRLMDLGGRIVRALAGLPKPSIASLNGVAAGAGCNLALACDVRIAAKSARLGQTFARVGLHPDWGGTYFLPRLAGPARSLEMFATGELVSAEEALAMGLVSHVVRDSQLRQATGDLAARLAAAPPKTYVSAREAVRRSLTASLAAMLAFEKQAQRICWESEDSAEGIRAFLERRPPRFTGR